MERKTGRGARRPHAADDDAGLLEADLPDLLNEEDDIDGDLAHAGDRREEGETDPKHATAASDPDDAVFDAAAAGLASDVPVQVVVVLGKKTIALREVLKLRMGQVIDLGRAPNEVVDLVANGKLVAKGELVEIDGKLGVRIIKMVR